MKSTYIIACLFPLCLMVCLACPALLLSDIALPARQPRQVLKTPQRELANSDHTTLKRLYETHQWFKLRNVLRSTTASSFYQGAVAAVFNDISQAERNLEAVINSAPQSEEASDARSLLTYVYMRAGRYRQALLKVVESLLIKPDDEGLKNASALFGALSSYPEQSVEEKRFSRVRYTTKDGNLFIPVKVNGKPANYILDTGANFSLISDAEARRLGLKNHESGGTKVGDAAGNDIEVRIAVADELTVGHVRLKHVTFFVVKDDQQPFVELRPGERGVLGLPVLLAFQTLRWKQDGIFEIGFPAGL